MFVLRLISCQVVRAFIPEKRFYVFFCIEYITRATYEHRGETSTTRMPPTVQPSINQQPTASHADYNIVMPSAEDPSKANPKTYKYMCMFILVYVYKCILGQFIDMYVQSCLYLWANYIYML